jgi:hypothetical protein
MSSEDEDYANRPREYGHRPDRPLEPSELYDYRRDRPAIKRMVSNYQFASKFSTFLFYLIVYSAGVFGFVYGARSTIARVFEAIVGGS